MKNNNLTNIEVDAFIVEKVRHLTEDTYVVRFGKNEMDFRPGQHLVAGLENSSDLREYSIYNSDKDNFIEILVKEVHDGIVSKQLKKILPGDKIEIKGPYGMFMNKAKADSTKKYLFIASGTGISPFHSFIVSNPELDYTLLHGIKSKEEAYDMKDYKNGKYIMCTSRDDQGNFYGRVTDYLLENDFDMNTEVYLCGNSNMILDSIDILTAKGISNQQIFTEVYF